MVRPHLRNSVLERIASLELSLASWWRNRRVDPAGATRRRYGLDLKRHPSVSTLASLLARVYSDTATEDTVIHDHAFGGNVDTVPEVYCAITQSGYARWISLIPVRR